MSLTKQNSQDAQKKVKSPFASIEKEIDLIANSAENLFPEKDRSLKKVKK